MRCLWVLKKKTHLDLFSGIGGFALAAQAAGYTTIGFSEIDPFACQVLEYHWPDVRNYGDIRNLRNVRTDLITGGFPCQPFSVAGKRRGAADDRHLWPQMLRVVREAKPTWVLGENVPGIVSMELDRVLADLEKEGYACWTLIIPACAVDAKHRRDRVWIIAKRMVADTKGIKSGGISNDGSCPEPDLQDGISRKFGGSGCYATLAHAKHGQSRKPSQWQERSRIGERSVDGSGVTDPWHETEGPRERLEAEPELGGMVDGLSQGVDEDPCVFPVEPKTLPVTRVRNQRVQRLRGLGNAIVPQAAEQILKMMLETETTT